MEPITGMLIVGVGTYLINAEAAYRKKEISEAEYKRAMEAARVFENQLRQLRPSDTWQDINPELLKEVAKYSPEVAAFVQENAPQLITEAKSETEKRVQKEALQKYAAMSETGRDVISDAQREQALFEADARARSRQQQLQEALRRKGQLGSGQARALQFQLEQQEAQNARQAALQGVQESENRRRQSLSQAASLASQLRQSNLQVETANVNTMNSYNSRLANARNLYNEYAANTRNQAQQINQQREMERERYNLGLTNQYNMFNRMQREAAKERARQFDENLLNRMYDIREGNQGRRSQSEKEYVGDMGTAITSGLGAGMGAYSAISSANALQSAANLNQSKQAYYNNLLKSAGEGMVRGGAESATRSVYSQPNSYVLQNSQNQPQPINLGWTPSSPIDTTPAYFRPGYGHMTPEEEEFYRFATGGKQQQW